MKPEDQVEKLLVELYGPKTQKNNLKKRFLATCKRFFAERSQELKNLDSQTDPLWYKSHQNIGYILYADLFSPEARTGEKLTALRDNLDYFTDLGITLIHVLPILKSSGDAGFAVDNYGKVDQRFGKNQDLKKLIRSCHHKGIKIALDLVLNHTSDHHFWAQAAMRGHLKFEKFYIWSKKGSHWPGVPNIFPEFANGHWDWVPAKKKWVWSTFYKRHPDKSKQEKFPFAQWDLNYKNPEVLLSMLEILLNLANWGIDIFRLDAVPFLWKQKGTSCTSLPQTHTILALLRLGLEQVAPRTVFLAEANQKPKKLVRYFGKGDEVHLAYYFPLMPALWHAVVTGKAGQIKTTIRQMPPVPRNTNWWIYTECHDELSLEMVPKLLAKQLYDFLLESGGVPFRITSKEKFSRGISGTTYTLLRGNKKKIFLLWQVKLSLGWTPIFYQGEELGIENDRRYLNDPQKRKDSRFVKRVPLDKQKKEMRLQPGSKQAILFKKLKKLIAWRKQHPSLVSPPEFLETGHPSVLGYQKQSRQENMFIFANFSGNKEEIHVEKFGKLELKPWQFWWQVEKD